MLNGDKLRMGWVGHIVRIDDGRNEKEFQLESLKRRDYLRKKKS
jgi:hypothetical protein